MDDLILIQIGNDEEIKELETVIARKKLSCDDLVSILKAVTVVKKVRPEKERQPMFQSIRLPIAAGVTGALIATTILCLFR